MKNKLIWLPILYITMVADPAALAAQENENTGSSAVDNPASIKTPATIEEKGGTESTTDTMSPIASTPESSGNQPVSTTETMAPTTTSSTVATIKRKKIATTTTATTTTTTVSGADAVMILEARCFGSGDLLQVKAATSIGSGAILTVSDNETGVVIGKMMPANLGKNIFVLYKSKELANCPQSVKVTSSYGGSTVQNVNIIGLMR